MLWTGAKLDYPQGRVSDAHRHNAIQIFFVVSGLLNIRTVRGSWVVPPGRLGCIKPRVRHQATTLSPLKAWSAFCPEDKKSPFKEDISILRFSPLLHTLFERVAEKQKLNLSQSADKSLATLILNEMSTARIEPLGIPLPSSPGLVKISQAILANGSEGKTVIEFAKAAGMSIRSFSRHFHAETGLTFERWRTLANHQKAIELISNGESVTSAALTIGYDSISAFIASFRRHHGVSPLKFLQMEH